jgi:putative flavoprotein involved in K+ transport
MEAESFDTIVIGGSQAGLTAGYYLARQGREFLILEANESVGDAWRNRWDSLRLFTPAKFSRLPGMKVPNATAWDFVTKDEMADYLEEYARRFRLPVRTGVAVDGLTRNDGWFVLSAGERRFEAKNVIVATGAHQIPKVPRLRAGTRLGNRADAFI